MFSVKDLKNKIVNFFPIEIQKKLIAGLIALSAAFGYLLFCPYAYSSFILTIILFIVLVGFIAHLVSYCYSTSDKLSKKIKKVIFALILMSFGLFNLYLSFNKLDLSNAVFFHFWILFFVQYISIYYIELDKNAFFSNTSKFWIGCYFILNFLLELSASSFNYADYLNYVELNFFIFIVLLYSILDFVAVKIFSKFSSFYKKTFNMKNHSVFNSLIDVFNMINYITFFNMFVSIIKAFVFSFIPSEKSKKVF